jgi:hypothetical protein
VTASGDDRPDPRTARAAGPTGSSGRGRLPRAVRLVAIGVLVAVAVVVLFTVVFPWVEQRLENPTMGAPDVGARGTGAAAVAAGTFASDRHAG